MSELYDDLQADAEEVIAHLSEVIDRQAARIAKLEAEKKVLLEHNNTLRTAFTNAMDSILADAKRIAELEARLATSEELAEQHLAHIDSLERQLRDTEVGVRKMVGLQP